MKDGYEETTVPQIILTDLEKPISSEEFYCRIKMLCERDSEGVFSIKYGHIGNEEFAYLEFNGKV